MARLSLHMGVTYMRIWSHHSTALEFISPCGLYHHVTHSRTQTKYFLDVGALGEGARQISPLKPLVSLHTGLNGNIAPYFSSGRG